MKAALCIIVAVVGVLAALIISSAARTEGEVPLEAYPYIGGSLLVSVVSIAVYFFA